MRFVKRLLMIGTLSMLGACISTPPPPVINKSPHRQIPVDYQVRPGDSIYSISWEYGLDHLDIAKWNGVRPPYDLQSGQSLRLRPGAVAKPLSTEADSVVTAPLPATESVSKPAPVNNQPQPAPSQVAPAATVSNQPAQTAPKASSNKPLPKTPPGRWQWPAKGKVIARYSRDKGVNGIRISADPGTPVVATAGGDVVYVGEGLRGYGKLIILKHSDTYLSAYAHNRRILVKEGERIGAGQQIAEMGNSGADRTMLHFEIRVNGKPQDPLKYLKS